MATLDIPKLFRDSAQGLRDARERCIQVHGTDIRAAGNEVEIAVRQFFERILPERFCVTHGHLIDRNGTVSPQLDLIISDNTGLPSLLTTADGTRYIPVESVFAIAEVKSTFYRANQPISSFSRTLRTIRENMVRPLEKNTAFDGLQDSTLMRDLLHGSPHRYLNPLFSFMIFVDHGDVSEQALDSELVNNCDEDLPGMILLLNQAVVFYARKGEPSLSFEKYPSLVHSDEHAWHVSPLAGDSETGSLEGNHLGVLYYALVAHLNQSLLKPPDLRSYFASMLVGQRSTTREIQKPQQGVAPQPAALSETNFPGSPPPST
ncbi:MAG: hypothetical protein JNM99_14625 [Verrucomicrobiaceae bacterium]|nr:hypothetical protein [Verrucomicrobiaceae bacterium]